MQTAPQPSEALAYPFDQAAKISGLGRSTLYRLCNEGRLRKINIGRRALIDAASLRSLIADAA